MEITINLTETEYKALAYIAVDPQEWIQNLAQARAAAAIQEIYDLEVQRMSNDPNVESIPADKNKVVLEANIKTAAQRHEDFLQNNLPIPQTP